MDAATLTGEGAAERIGTAFVTDRFFNVLGARPILGRVFHEGDDKPAAPKTVVLSEPFWSRHFQRDPGVVGRTLALGGVAHAIVGVMPASFSFPREVVEVWQILTMTTPPRRGPFYTRGVARLKPNATLDEMRANLGAVASSLKRRYPGPDDWRLDAIPLQESIVGGVRQVLYVLLGAVAFLLLI